MSDFYNNFKTACNKKGISPSALLTKMGKSNSIVTQWKNGSLPSVEIIPALTDALDTTADFLIFGNEHFSDLSDDEKELIALFRQIPYDEQVKLIGRTEDIVERCKPTIQIPCSEYKVSAGTGFEIGDYERWNKIDVPDTPAARKANFALEIQGDSMEPIYVTGDIVLVKEMPVIDKGQIGIFRIEDRGFIKKFGGDRLISINAEYEDILFSDHDSEQIVCCGLVVGRV